MKKKKKLKEGCVDKMTVNILWPQNLSPIHHHSRGVACVALFITDHEQTQFNRVCFFHFSGVFCFQKVKLCRTYVSTL